MKIKKDTIFVSVATYRDISCSTTISDIFDKAYNKSNIYVGIMQQNNSEDSDCQLNNELKEYNKNIRIIRIPHFEAKGPTYARYWCSTLWNGEEYFLQIDSHTNFVKNWDTKLINMIKNIKKEGNIKPIISHYPPSITQNIENTDKVPMICKAEWNSNNMPRFTNSDWIKTNNKFYKTPFIAAGMLFSESTFLQDVPFDPNLPYVFIGEEILLSARAYTNGYDVFIPTENIITHEYTREESPKVWDDNAEFVKLNTPAFNKIKYYLGMYNEKNLDNNMKVNLDKYSLGKIRSLQQYYDFAGINTKDKKIYKDFCKLYIDNDQNNNIKETFIDFQKKQYNYEYNKSVYIYCKISLLILLLLLTIFLYNIYKKIKILKKNE
jgi:hypothetical protein